MNKSLYEDVYEDEHSALSCFYSNNSFIGTHNSTDTLQNEEKLINKLPT